MRPHPIAAILTGALVATSCASCATRAPSDQIILYYSSGVGENKKFVECVEPGQSGSYPIDDETYALPTSLRTWNIRSDGGDTKDPITSGSKPANDGQPGPEVSIFATADFYLNTDCSDGEDSPVVRFWEQTGRRYKIAKNGEDGDGFDERAWRTMLMNTLVPAEEKALREETRKYTADDLAANLDGVWRRLEAGMANTFARELRAKVGGDYFCGTGYAGGRQVSWDEPVIGADGKVSQERRSGGCPPVRISITDINFSDPGIAKARADVFAAEQRAKAALIAAQAEVDKARLLSQAAQDAAYVRLREIEAQLEAAKACAASQSCTLVIGADGVVAGR